ncbi:hypothetical protein LEN26_011619 [Aphanomyces euteiches]|nr:hypothetical protein AeMF1_011422 [Aphanomyces euteiches]KAH9119490.1 hypothetical protein LEN26_011619 [Aphanomyces euteiches]KAH9185361.1 hypothetical protein AeNC1_012666 [Aphanomyces euteiches]
MSRVFRRSVGIMRRSGRRFNTTQQNPAEGGTGTVPPPPQGEYEWSRRLNEWEKRYKQYANRERRQGSPWGASVWAFAGGAFIGYISRPNDSHYRFEESRRRYRDVERDFKEETRELKQRLALIQQSIDQIKVQQYSQPPVYSPPRPQQ